MSNKCFDKVLIIDIKEDVPSAKLLLDYPELHDCNLSNGNNIWESGTSIFVDKSNGSVVVRRPNKDLLLVYGQNRLFIDFKDNCYQFSDEGDEFLSSKLTNEGKHYLYDKIIKFMRNFKEIDKHLPLESTFNFMFLQMGIFNRDDVEIVYDDASVILYLSSFRSLDLSKLKLNIADAYTFEVVGTIEVSLNKRDESNFSYSGNVSYHILEGYQNKGYATSSLSALVSYINRVSDEYNKVLYIAALKDAYAYQAVALNNGAVLEYDGKVPDGDTLATLNKVNEIKIYRIDGMQHTN